MNKDIIAGVATILVVMPIWYYLLYSVLVRVNASELMWFLYWVYVPVGLISHAALNVAKAPPKADK